MKWHSSIFSKQIGGKLRQNWKLNYRIFKQTIHVPTLRDIDYKHAFWYAPHVTTIGIASYIYVKYYSDSMTGRSLTNNINKYNDQTDKLLSSAKWNHILDDCIYNTRDALQQQTICDILEIENIDKIKYSIHHLEVQSSSSFKDDSYTVVCPLHYEDGTHLANVQISMKPNPRSKQRNKGVNTIGLDCQSCSKIELIPMSSPNTVIELYVDPKPRIEKLYNKNGLFGLRDEIIRQFELQDTYMINVSNYVNAKYQAQVTKTEYQTIIELPLFDAHHKNKVELSHHKMVIHLMKAGGTDIKNDSLGILEIGLETVETERISQLCIFDNWQGHAMYKPTQKAHSPSANEKKKQASAIHAIYDLLY